MTSSASRSVRIKRRELISYLERQFQIDWLGHHGIPHWARVRANGLMLSKELDANTHVIELFAFFHDACRLNEYEDPGHGGRGAALAQRLRGDLFQATDEEMALLTDACNHHSSGYHSDAELTVMVCWDADRLDLGRVGITPDPRYMSTNLAKMQNVIAYAHYRALAWKAHYQTRGV